MSSLHGAVQLVATFTFDLVGKAHWDSSADIFVYFQNRFSAHPDIYKQFLEILQTYQREAKPIQDVYSQVCAFPNTLTRTSVLLDSMASC